VQQTKRNQCRRQIRETKISDRKASVHLDLLNETVKIAGWVRFFILPARQDMGKTLHGSRIAPVYRRVCHRSNWHVKIERQTDGKHHAKAKYGPPFRDKAARRDDQTNAQNRHPDSYPNTHSPQLAGKSDVRIKFGQKTEMAGDETGREHQRVRKENVPAQTWFADGYEYLQANRRCQQKLAVGQRQPIGKAGRAKIPFAFGIGQPTHQLAKDEGEQQQAQRPRIWNHGLGPKRAVEAKSHSGHATAYNAKQHFVFRHKSFDSPHPVHHHHPAARHHQGDDAARQRTGDCRGYRHPPGDV